MPSNPKRRAVRPTADSRVPHSDEGSNSKELWGCPAAAPAWPTVLVAITLLLASLVCLQTYIFARHPSLKPAPEPGQAPAPAPRRGRPKVYTYEVVAAHRHDPEAFTQGLLCASGADAAAASSTSEEDCAVFWESTGLYGRTSVRLVDRKSGKVLRQQPPAAIDDQHFGEGVVAVGDELLLLTWQSNVGLVFDRRTLEPKREFTHPMTDGWGLTVASNGDLIGTDSTDVLYTLRWDPANSSMQELRRVQITDTVLSAKTGAARARPVKWLNEIEWVEPEAAGGAEAEVWGMIWQTECVARVSPESGEVVGWIDFSGLRGKMVRRARKKGLDVTAVDVLNGIAWHQDSGRLWITGKQWPALYEVKLIEVDNTDPQLRSIRRKCIK